MIHNITLYKTYDGSPGTLGLWWSSLGLIKILINAPGVISSPGVIVAPIPVSRHIQLPLRTALPAPFGGRGPLSGWPGAATALPPPSRLPVDPACPWSAADAPCQRCGADQAAAIAIPRRS